MSALLIRIISWLLLFIRINQVCNGIHEIAKIKGVISQSAQSESNWGLFAAYQIIMLLFIFTIAIGFTPLVVILVIIGFILGIVMLIRFMHMFSECSHVL
jgi:Flp pilus assembly protein TadB